MSLHIKLLFSTAALLLHSSCVGTGSRQDPAGTEPPYEGIRTRPISAAPATQPANNSSRPLSQQNTPTAVAAREAAVRQSREVPGGAQAAAPARANSANPELAAFLATATNAVPAALRPNTGFQKGSKVQLRSGTSLYAQPNKASQTALITEAVSLELGPQMVNADGHWWYVTAGKESGWLLQADIPR